MVIWQASRKLIYPNQTNWGELNRAEAARGLEPHEKRNTPPGVRRKGEIHDTVSHVLKFKEIPAFYDIEADKSTFLFFLVKAIIVGIVFYLLHYFTK